ncbi:HD domain-containing protein (plasmid) [Aureimonas ureilytica]|uniref:HD domain-containing protein n=1 Tax=Aureimonas ureilytica TaxID=401562 RepID=UPI003CE9A042
MSNPRLEQQLAFLIEADALKAVERQSRIVKGRRRENSAEHSWHLALFALVLGPERPDIDVSRVVAMLLLHDLVEIDAGDNPMHGAFDADGVAEAEDAAAKRLFGLLPGDLADRFEGLWREFEAAETPDARFARALDRFQPLLLNTLTDGGTWTENDVSEAQVHARYGPVIEKGSPDWWAHARALVARHFASSDR